MNARGDGKPNVEIRCGADYGSREWWAPIGGVWFTEFGDVLVVRWELPDGDMGDFLDVEKSSTWASAPQHHRLADDFMVEEQPVLLDRPGQRFPAWCRDHGSWFIDESAVEIQARKAKRSRKTEKYRAVPPTR